MTEPLGHSCRVDIDVLLFVTDSLIEELLPRPILPTSHMIVSRSCRILVYTVITVIRAVIAYIAKSLYWLLFQRQPCINTAHNTLLIAQPYPRESTWAFLKCNWVLLCQVRLVAHRDRMANVRFDSLIDMVAQSWLIAIQLTVFLAEVVLFLIFILLAYFIAEFDQIIMLWIYCI